MKKLLLTIGIGLAVLFILAIFIYPEPNKEYTGFWYSFVTGSFHGACLIPNWIISFFNPNHLIKATSYSANYNFFWWAWAIGNIFNLLINPFITFFSKKINTNIEEVDRRLAEVKHVIDRFSIKDNQRHRYIELRFSISVIVADLDIENSKQIKDYVELMELTMIDGAAIPVIRGILRDLLLKKNVKSSLNFPLGWSYSDVDFINLNSEPIVLPNLDYGRKVNELFKNYFSKNDFYNQWNKFNVNSISECNFRAK